MSSDREIPREDFDMLCDLISRNGMSNVLLEIADMLDGLRYKGQAEALQDMASTIDDSHFED